MLDNTHTTATRLPSLFACRQSTRTFPSQLPHACAVRLLPHRRRHSYLWSTLLHPPLAFVHARWKCEYPLSLPAPFLEIPQVCVVHIRAALVPSVA